MRSNCSSNISKADASKDEAGVAIPISQVFSVSAQAVSTGASTGSVQIQVSNDLPGSLSLDSSGNAIPVNWSNLGSALTVGAASVTYLAQTNVCATYLRAVYTHNNGSAGTITVNIATQAY